MFWRHTFWLLVDACRLGLPKVRQRVRAERDAVRAMHRETNRYHRDANMTDRELLELAAKAAGLEICAWSEFDQPLIKDGEYVVAWCPLIDDGDALRLAVKIEADVFVRGGRWSEAVGPMTPSFKEPHNDYPCAATRRAIVRAAAEIGRTR